MSTKVHPITSQPSPTGKATTLSNEEITRYSRHLIMPEVGMEGQLKLKNAKVLFDRHGRTWRRRWAYISRQLE